jgi:CRISPR-associated protein Cas6
VQEMLFAISGRHLPVNHLQELSEEILSILPWIKQEPQAGIHEIYVSATANGWHRPTDQFYLSKRSRLILRIPKHRIADTKMLSGKVLNIKQNKLITGKEKTRLLQNTPTLFSHHIALPDTEKHSEEEFLSQVAYLFQQKLAITLKKMLCGISGSIPIQGKTLFTRSLMIADLTAEESLYIQEQGI